MSRAPRTRMDGIADDAFIDEVGTVEIAPRRARAVEPVVIFLHGRGQQPRAVHKVAPAFESARVVAPRGGVPLEKGTTWFENVSVGVADPESVRRAEQRFLGWLETRFVGTARPWLCGFSNGGAFAGHLLMRHPARFSGAALLSAPLVMPPWDPDAFRSKRVFYGRGDRDGMVPAAMFEAAETHLARASRCAVTLRRYDMAHEILPAEVDDLMRWFDAGLPFARGGTEPG